MLVSDLKSLVPNIPWLDYINGMLTQFYPTIDTMINETMINQTKIKIIGLPYFERLSRILQETPKKVLANYVYYRAIESISVWKKDFNDTRDIKIEEQLASKLCTETIVKDFPVAASALYIRKHFNHSDRMAAMEIYENVFGSFRETLKYVISWDLLAS